jgi:hypothetical protein
MQIHRLARYTLAAVLAGAIVGGGACTSAFPPKGIPRKGWEVLPVPSSLKVGTVQGKDPDSGDWRPITLIPRPLAPAPLSFPTAWCGGGAAVALTGR